MSASRSSRADIVAAAEGALGPDGSLADALPGFEPRPVQQSLAVAVAEAIATGATLVAEAGTGTGKTYGYLVPVLLAGHKTIVSTGTRTLQDQLFQRDIPRVLGALGLRPKLALLKGRANYLCQYRLEAARGARAVDRPDWLAQLEEVSRWSKQTQSGDLAEVPDLAEDSSLTALVTSSSDNCLGSECAYFGECFLLRARRRAQEADLVIVNHHLLFADMALKREGFAALLPSAAVVVIDEAHQLAETATRFFGDSLSTRQLSELVRDTRAEAVQQPGAFSALDACLDRLQKWIYDLRATMQAQSQRGVWKQQRDRPPVRQAIDELTTSLVSLLVALEPLVPASRGLESCYARAAHLQGLIARLVTDDPEGWVSWYELHRATMVVYFSPLDVAAPMQEFRSTTEAAWVFTSATLAVGESFDLFNAQLGLREPLTLQLPSPFDYRRNALLYHPTGMPEPAASDYVACLVEAALPVLEYSRGRAFFLFTSHRNLRLAAAMLSQRIDMPLFVQGEQSRHYLLESFRRSGNGILLGAASFWEGVDVVGGALSLVVIDKLPFAAPDDPILEARLSQIRARGEHPFWSYQLPAAVLALKQGAGRLIRDPSDRGVLMLCDPRLATRGYGRVFSASLPDMVYSRELADVARFFR